MITGLRFLPSSRGIQGDGARGGGGRAQVKREPFALSHGERRWAGLFLVPGYNPCLPSSAGAKGTS